MRGAFGALIAGLICVLSVACGALADDLFCDTELCAFSRQEWQRLISLGNPGDAPQDGSNRFSQNEAAIRLGQKFFFDTRFSGPITGRDPLGRMAIATRAPPGTPSQMSCASCHDPEAGGADRSSQPGHVSIGAGATDVNASSVLNAGYRRLWFWNGRADSLWALAVAVAESGTTMNGNRLRTAHVMFDHYADDPDFADLLSDVSVQRIAPLPSDGKPGRIPGCQPGNVDEPFGDSYDCLEPADRRLVTSLLVDWAKIVSAYQETLLSRDSAFDRFVSEGASSPRLSPAAKRGARLFVGRAACADCHAGPLLSDDEFHNIGVPQNGPGVPVPADCLAGSSCDCEAGRNCLPWGAADGLDKLKRSSYLRTSEWSDDPRDQSRSALVEAEPRASLRGAWRTPSLRDVALTAPYMHDGVYPTLRDVLWHYNLGGRQSHGVRVGTAVAAIKPLGLTEAELGDLQAFLESLTGAPLPAALVTVPELPR